MPKQTPHTQSQDTRVEHEPPIIRGPSFRSVMRAPSDNPLLSETTDTEARGVAVLLPRP